jgi:short-subunit dehydrogenase
MRAAERGRRGEVYILAGERVSVAGLLEHVQEASGTRSPMLYIPTKLALAAAPLTALYARLSGTRPQFTTYSLETLLSNSRISCEKARRELDYRPRPLAVTIWDTVRWWREQEGTRDAVRPAPARLLPGPAAPRRRGLAVVTGASSGIGAETASRLASLGYRVVLAARRRDRLEALAADIRGAGGAAEVVAVDLSAEDGPRRLFDEVSRRFGEADVLVNNAGFGWYGYFDQMPADTARAMIQVNSVSPIQLAALFLPGMKERRRGHIINVSSVAGSIPSQGVAVYSATKSFVDSFTTALYREMAGTGVAVSAVRPGAVASEFSSVAAGLSAGRPVPAGRLAVPPSAVAQVICGLLSRPRRAAYVPRGLMIVPWIEFAFGWLIDLLGPLLLRRQSLRA